MKSEAASNHKRVCTHLLESKDVDYCQRFTGNGLEYDLVCSECAATPADIQSKLRDVDQRRFEEIEQDACWDGIIGEPEVRKRNSGLRFTHETIDIPEINTIQFHDIQPIISSPNVWLGLSFDGTLFSIDLTKRSMVALFRIPEGTLDLNEKAMLRVSHTGDWIAVVNTKGQHGIVADAKSGQTTLLLDRGNYHEDVSTFSVALFEWEGRTLVVHATAWNRLDVSEARTGMLLTDRSPTSYQQGETHTQHDLDYFHCALTVSPNQQFIVDTGWVWHPVGVIASWSIPNWLQQNVWESENGDSKREFCDRAYYWDSPTCWLDNRHLAVWGYGQDEAWQIPAICVFDVVTGKQDRWFPGPKGNLVFDEHLFSWDKEGMTVWDVSTGERLAIDETLNPIAFHPGSKNFLSICNASVQISRFDSSSSPRGNQSN